VGAAGVEGIVSNLTLFCSGLFLGIAIGVVLWDEVQRRHSHQRTEREIDEATDRFAFRDRTHERRRDVN
jgi:preprotein translocase subunit SecG